MPRPLLRTIDANANRAREALRVMEDVARFSLGDAELCERLKAMRHDLAAAMRPLESAAIIAHRDTPGDVGTGISTDAERTLSGRDIKTTYDAVGCKKCLNTGFSGRKAVWEILNVTEDALRESFRSACSIHT